MAWRPGQRANDRALEAPYEDVPDHILAGLWAWVQTSCAQDGGRTRPLGVHLRIPLPNDYASAMAALAKKCEDDRTFLLDIVEALLEMFGWDENRAAALRALLRNANSAYDVNDTWNGLMLRVTPEVKDQVQAVVDAAIGSPGDHLKNAWDEAYGRKPDPVKSYSESIKAVESALAPIVSPANLKATLGTIIRDVKAKPSKWEFAIADGNVSGVETVLKMTQVLWDGQTSRHGGVGTTRAETSEEARAAVHLAATLVQFAVGGSFSVA